jgi:tetraprenyl-beta-curcumene synthase
MPGGGRICLLEAACFARAARQYWRHARPQAFAELHAWRERAACIPDDTLRAAALCALDTKRCDLEGAVGFAAMFADAANMDRAVRAIASFQLAFDYLDCVVELPNPDPVANSQSLHRALFAALDLANDCHDYYERQGNRRDAGYLQLLVESCRQAGRALPAFDAIGKPARAALRRVVTYQSLSHGDRRGSHASFLRWAESQTVPGSGLWWWEAGAATGSQLSLLALIAAAADSNTRYEDAQAIESAYFPWVGALSTLLDSVVDRDRDRTEGKPSLLDYYPSSGQIRARLQLMATEAVSAVSPLVDAHRHRMLFAAMGAFFHSRPGVDQSDAYAITKGVVDALGVWTVPAKLALRVHRATEKRTGQTRVAQSADKYK